MSLESYTSPQVTSAYHAERFVAGITQEGIHSLIQNDMDLFYFTAHYSDTLSQNMTASVLSARPAIFFIKDVLVSQQVDVVIIPQKIVDQSLWQDDFHSGLEIYAHGLNAKINEFSLGSSLNNNISPLR